MKANKTAWRLEEKDKNVSSSRSAEKNKTFFFLTHRDTTILFSLDFCYMFLHKTSYQAVVSAENKKQRLHLTFNTCPQTSAAHTRCRTLTFSLQLDNMLIMLRQTDCTESAGDQSSVRIDRQMWPLLYTCGWTGIFSPVNITCTMKAKQTTSTQLNMYR